MFIGEEVCALEELVAGKHPVVLARTDQGGVMTDPKPQRSALRRGDPAAYPLNQFIFENSQWREWFGARIILAAEELTVDLL